MRHAVKLAKVAKLFHSTICLKRGPKVDDLRSIISIISLCAVMGTYIDMKITGEDEQEAARAMERVFIAQIDSSPNTNAASLSRTGNPNGTW